MPIEQTAVQEVIDVLEVIEEVIQESYRLKIQENVFFRIAPAIPSTRGVNPCNWKS